MKQQLMMLLLGTASVFCSCETQVEQHHQLLFHNLNHLFI